VVLSERGWVRAGKGHDLDPTTLPYKSGDSFLQAACGRSNRPAVFIDSMGRTYSLPAHELPSAKGHGEPLTALTSPAPGAAFVAVIMGNAEDLWLITTDDGYGFVARLEDLMTDRKAVVTIKNDGARFACGNGRGAGMLRREAIVVGKTSPLTSDASASEVTFTGQRSMPHCACSEIADSESSTEKTIFAWLIHIGVTRGGIFLPPETKGRWSKGTREALAPHRLELPSLRMGRDFLPIHHSSHGMATETAPANRHARGRRLLNQGAVPTRHTHLTRRATDISYSMLPTTSTASAFSLTFTPRSRYNNRSPFSCTFISDANYRRCRGPRTAAGLLAVCLPLAAPFPLLTASAILLERRLKMLSSMVRSGSLIAPSGRWSW